MGAPTHVDVRVPDTGATPTVRLALWPGVEPPTIQSTAVSEAGNQRRPSVWSTWRVCTAELLSCLVCLTKGGGGFQFSGGKVASGEVTTLVVVVFDVEHGQFGEVEP